ncbi:MAG: hypothetical protein WDA14_08475 [Sphaerochaetaceae bacterium]
MKVIVLQEELDNIFSLCGLFLLFQILLHLLYEIFGDRSAGEFEQRKFHCLSKKAPLVYETRVHERDPSPSLRIDFD